VDFVYFCLSSCLFIDCHGVVVFSSFKKRRGWRARACVPRAAAPAAANRRPNPSWLPRDAAAARRSSVL